MESKEGTDALFLFASEGILVANGESEIIRVNPSAEKLFGYEKDELIGQKIEILIPRRLAEKHVDQRTKYNSSPQARTMGSGLELFGLKKDVDNPLSFCMIAETVIVKKNNTTRYHFFIEVVK